MLKVCCRRHRACRTCRLFHCCAIAISPLLAAAMPAACIQHQKAAHSKMAGVEVDSSSNDDVYTSAVAGGDRGSCGRDNTTRWVEKLSDKPRAYLFHNFLSHEEVRMLARLHPCACVLSLLPLLPIGCIYPAVVLIP